MDQITTDLERRGEVFISTRETAESYWQPLPANGFVEVLLAPHMVEMEQPFSMGTQTVAPGSFVRSHAHDRNQEVIYVLNGTGVAELESGDEPMTPGKLLYFGHNRTHKFVNTGTDDLTFMWVMVPAGLETFFKGIGKPRNAGDATPPNFPRPENVREIEAQTVFSSKLTVDPR
jgi:mannose-6-phosphate isomerase-like protein (cupin superfamily)